MNYIEACTFIHEGTPITVEGSLRYAIDHGLQAGDTVTILGTKGLIQENPT